MLVIMETLSDFGAVEHFAVQTFTTGIFRTWYGLYDLQTAMQRITSLINCGSFIFLREITEENKFIVQKTLHSLLILNKN